MCVVLTAALCLQQSKKPWGVVGWKGGWMGGWMDGKAGLRIAYSNQKSCKCGKLMRSNPLPV